jgi:hypothetical protein
LHHPYYVLEPDGDPVTSRYPSQPSASIAGSSSFTKRFPTIHLFGKFGVKSDEEMAPGRNANSGYLGYVYIPVVIYAYVAECSRVEKGRRLRKR